jgi:alkanesulfonate monooxygenase SsuD/methylene tetrahydromethanopterin reductase-like flavin-dependent oxidoreductase (luciferase family)
MRVCLMIEGQEDVDWPEWLALASACEEHGIETLFRSDHYVSVDDRREHGSLDAWGTICALGAVTSRLRLGTLVSPASFRHPSVLAKSVVTADHISGGRVELGMGAGWWRPEHDRYGFPFHDTGTRLDVLEEQLEVVHGAFADEPFDFGGEHYAIRDLEARPKPVQRPHPPLILGGTAGRRSAALAARFADEYNTIFASPEVCAERRRAVAEAWERHGRDPGTLRFSLMTGCLIGADRADLHERARRLADRRGEDPGDPAAYVDGLRETWVAGTLDEAADHLRELEETGVERVMLQHLLHDDLDAVELIGRRLAPAVA